MKKCVNIKLYFNVFWFYGEWLTCVVGDITESFLEFVVFYILDSLFFHTVPSVNISVHHS